jgi:hypothetical protein
MRQLIKVISRLSLVFFPDWKWKEKHDFNVCIHHVVYNYMKSYMNDVLTLSNNIHVPLVIFVVLLLLQTRHRDYHWHRRCVLIIIHMWIFVKLGQCFSFGYCVVCPSLIYGFWLPLWYLQTFSFKSLFYVVC